MLPRDLKNPAAKRPQLTDLCESGSTGQDADMVIFFRREEYRPAWLTPRPIPRPAKLRA